MPLSPDTAAHLWLYFLLVAGIIVLPGMDMAFVLGSTLVGGRRAGFAAVGGIVVGGVVHLLMGVAGIALVLLAAPGLFNALLLAGALYVGWIGLALWRGAAPLGEVDAPGARPLAATFVRAVLTCLLNPKAYVFMLAVFPQFLRPGAEPLAQQAAVLGSITAGTQLAVYGAVALAAARLRGWLRGHGPAQRRLGQGVGALLIAVAMFTLLQAWQRG
ncbi:MAG: LysE family translocator [Burkholderiales bacterium]|nr:LysE family translocator [Burkholderiales bacterium]